MDTDELHWSIADGPYRFHWRLTDDLATVQRDGKTIWTGGLLPLFEVSLPDNPPRRTCVAAQVRPDKSVIDEDSATLALVLPGYGQGELRVRASGTCVYFDRLTVDWDAAAPPIVALYFGAKLLTDQQRQVVSDLSRDFWPSWQSDGYCVPAFKGGPEQSFFRRWEVGQATLALGNFGPALGTPYAAAFPRPLYSAAMGNRSGWVALGCGQVPDGAMLLQLRNSCAQLEYRYREDLWGPPPGSRRTWEQPLRLTWADSAWEAYDRLFATFDVGGPVDGRHQMAVWNTWGDFRNKDFKLAPMVTLAGDLGVKALCLDDGWETFISSGVPHRERFADYDEQLVRARKLGMDIGFWAACGWVTNPDEAGLTADDLLVGMDGRPRRGNWGMNPHEGGVGGGHFCLDPSSAGTREFLRRRTMATIEEAGGAGGAPAALLKMDFAYGLPSPDVATPRDPNLRGERMGFALLTLIADAARQTNPNLTLKSYGIHPLLRRVSNVVSLDDLGDAGGQFDASYEIKGHGQWSVWAALLGRQGTAINASCGYNPLAEAEILLNTAVVGAPGWILDSASFDDPVVGPGRRRRATAIARWHRRRTRWRPLWLDSEKGQLGQEPELRCWGRLEPTAGGEALTALALRDSDLRQAPPVELGIVGWNGRWALISQDDRSIRASHKLAIIPVDEGRLELRLDHAPAKVTAVTLDGERTAHEARIDGATVRLDVGAPVVGYLIEGRP